MSFNSIRLEQRIPKQTKSVSYIMKEFFEINPFRMDEQWLELG